ncbi:MAG: hypothetical protein ACJ74U_06170 [Jatrophihabitantaceae bacterium]
MRRPKLEGVRPKQYYRYYAGYTQGFVEDMLAALEIEFKAIVLDPWNGAGTTTVAAAATGFTAVGFDLNPAAGLIARARLLASDVADSLVPLRGRILNDYCSFAEPVEPHGSYLMSPRDAEGRR